jgi:hypothetical protein
MANPVYFSVTTDISDEAKANEIIAEMELIEDIYDFNMQDQSASGEMAFRHEDNIKSFSINHPGILFEFECEDGGTGDRFKEFYRDGKYCYIPGVVTYEEFDEAKLI